MIDNFNQISRLLTFNSEDEFYFVQILQRKKDNPSGTHGSNNSSRLIKAYYISSVQKLLELKEEMVFFADHFNARVGINLNKRSYYKTAFNTLRHIAEQMHNKNFKDVRKSYNTACGIHNSIDDKRWILDIDTKISESDILHLEGLLKGFKPEGDKVIITLPSRSGIHIITSPFNLEEASSSLFFSSFNIEIHKNNPTNLYIP